MVVVSNDYIKMENMGFQDSTKFQKLNRYESVSPQEEDAPLFKTQVSYTVSHGHSDHEDPEVILDEECVPDDFEYMECDPSPPEHVYENFEEKEDFTLQICENTISMDLLEHMEESTGRMELLEDIENGKIAKENVKEAFKGATQSEINICFLWAAFLKLSDLLEEFIKMGAEISYYEPNSGLGALHLASFSNCTLGVKTLLAQGCDVNAIFKCYSPLHCAALGDSTEAALVLLNNGARLFALSNNPCNCQENILHCSVRANAMSCVKLFIQAGADVEQTDFFSMSPLHLAAYLGHLECLRMLLERKSCNVNFKTKDKEQTALHLAAENGCVDCLELLLEMGADANVRDRKAQTPLHLASRTQACICVEVLLNKGSADPNIGDCDKRTALHAAVDAKSYNVMELLLSYGALVNARDKFGYTPLHIAAFKGLTQCVENLIYYGADITAKSNFGMTALGIMKRKIPGSISVINEQLNSSITRYRQESMNQEIEIKLDFRCILQFCHPREISFLNTFVEEGLKEVLLHPLCSAFLYLKWEKMRKYYLARMFFYLIFVLSLTLYVLTALAHNCYNHGKKLNENDTFTDEDVIELCEKKSIMGRLLRHNPFFVEMQWFVLVGITCCEIIRKICGMPCYHSVKQYLSYPENIMEWAVIVSVFVISFIYAHRTYTWQNHIGAFAVLFAWTNLMLMTGQLPAFGSYVAMYTRVQSEFTKLLLAYSCLLIGFTLTFCIMFPDSDTFANPFIGLITVLVMMSGELSLDILVDDNPEDPHFLLDFSAQFTYILFVLFVTVILMNLLVGIAVDDIQGLQKTAGLSKLVRQTKLISQMEQALFNGSLPQYILNWIHWSALVSPKSYNASLNVKPLHPQEKRLPRDILTAAYNMAKNGRSKNLIDGNLESNKDIPDLNALFPLLQSKLEERNKEIDVLIHDITELKRAFEEREERIEELFRTLTQRRRNSKI